MWPSPQFPAGLVTLTEEILSGNFIVFVQWLFFDVSGAFWKKIQIIIWKVM